MPGFSARPQLGPVDLGATNDQYEFKVSIEVYERVDLVTGKAEPSAGDQGRASVTERT